MRIKILLIGLCIILLVGCKSEQIIFKTTNDSNPIQIEMNPTNDTLNEEEIIELITTVNHSVLSHIYEPTLNMSELLYKGEEVDWVYQIEVPIDGYMIQIVPCIMLKNESRYCKD